MSDNAERFFASVDFVGQLIKLSDAELALMAVNEVWSDMDVLSRQADIVGEMIARLANDDESVKLAIMHNMIDMIDAEIAQDFRDEHEQ